MLVKKIKSSWQPSENRGLKVGDTIDITDPQALIINGDVVAVSEDGVEMSAYDLYGVVTKDAMSEFEAFQKMKRQEALKKQLEEEQAKLKEELSATTAEVKATVPAATSTDDLESLAYFALTKKARELGIDPVGMKKPAIIAAIRAK